MKKFLILIIFFIVSVFAFFISRYLYSFPLFYEHEKLTFYFILLLSAFLYFILLKIFYR